MIARFSVEVAGLPAAVDIQERIAAAVAHAFEEEFDLSGTVTISGIEFELSREELDTKPS